MGQPTQPRPGARNGAESLESHQPLMAQVSSWQRTKRRLDTTNLALLSARRRSPFIRVLIGIAMAVSAISRVSLHSSTPASQPAKRVHKAAVRLSSWLRLLASFLKFSRMGKHKQAKIPSIPQHVDARHAPKRAKHRSSCSHGLLLARQRHVPCTNTRT